MPVHKPKWSIQYFIPLSGGPAPVAQFIENLPEKAKAKLSNTFELLKEFGTQVGTPHIKKLSGTVLWEIRILGRDNIRILYIIPQKEVFLLLHGFIKKKQKTPTKEIKAALARLKEFQSRK